MIIGAKKTAETAEIPADTFSGFYDAVPSGIIIIDRYGNVDWLNRAGVSMLGSDCVGKSWLTIIKTKFQMKADDGHEISLKSGRKVQVSTMPFPQTNGQLVQLTDLTETRQMQDKIRQMEKLSNLGRMAATLVHQIRTPLSAAMLYAANLGNARINAADRNSIQIKLMDRLRDLERQVSDVLLFARSGDNIVEHVEVCDLVDDIARAAEGMFDEAGADLIVETDDPPLTMIANPSAIKGAVTNLMHNALQANATTVKMKLVGKDELIQLKIIDNGDGMDEKTVASAFDPFFTTKSAGTGLGLAIVKAVVTAHHGTVRIASAKGQGTCFTITFPRCAEGSQKRAVNE